MGFVQEVNCRKFLLFHLIWRKSPPVLPFKWRVLLVNVKSGFHYWNQRFVLNGEIQKCSFHCHLHRRTVKSLRGHKRKQWPFVGKHCGTTNNLKVIMTRVASLNPQ